MRVVVVGASEEALELIKEFVTNGHDVVVLDDNKSRIDRVVQELDVAAYTFSVIDIDVFQQIGMHKADLVIAMHPIDTVNILVCTIAKHFNVPKVFAVVNTKEALNIIHKLGLANNVLLRSRAMHRVLLEVLFNINLAEFDDNHYIMFIKVDEDSPLYNKKVDDVDMEGAKIISIVSSDNNVVNFDKNYVIKKNDKVIMVISKDKFESFVFKH